ncbi:MAG TPA: hypothetical protein VNO30_41110 [Kofleriaceae bacterium]|nr:hypothetical protein [Kofleriaceae bacterium]
MAARTILAPLALLGELACGAAIAHASPRSDPTSGRAVFTGATLPSATSIGLNPAALGIGPFGEVVVALTSTLDQIGIDAQELDVATGALVPTARVRAVELSPGGMVGLVLRTGRYTLGVQALTSPAEQFVAGERALRYHTSGGSQRDYVGTVAGSIRVTSKFFVGAHVAHDNTFLRLSFARDTALAAGGAPGGQNSEEAYDVCVRSPYIGSSNLKVTVGLAAEIYRDVWIGLAYHTPPGLAIQTELEGDADVTLSPRAGGELRDGDSSVYVQYPASVDGEVRARIVPELELDLHVGGRWEDLSRLQAYDVRMFGRRLVGTGVPEWVLRARGFHDSFALWAGIERYEAGQMWRYGARVGYETGSVDDRALSPMAVAPRSFTFDAGGQLRLGDTGWAVQLSYGLQLFPSVTVTESAFDPRLQIACVDSGYDYNSRGCEASRAGYAIATAAGTYSRLQHALRLGLRYALP